MSHKTEAEKMLYLAYSEVSDSEIFFNVQAAFAEATLALVEAQERANEQARIANLIALYLAGSKDLWPSIQEFADEAYDLLADIQARRALGLSGIEVAE